MDFEKLTTANWLMVAATGLGAFGNFQSAPKWFSRMGASRIIQVLVMFVLLFQGGGGADPLISMVGAIVIYLLVEITKVIDIIYFPDEE